jgi:hypothetical protein
MSERAVFESWAIVEVMGHRQFAGWVTEHPLGGASFVRVDVPEIEDRGEVFPAFTKLLGAGSIYAISPCTEETARAFAAQSKQRSFSVYEAPRLPAPSAACAPDPDDYGYKDDEDEDDEERWNA